MAAGGTAAADVSGYKARNSATDRAMASMLLVGEGDLNFDDARKAGRSLLERTDAILESKRVRQ